MERMQFSRQKFVRNAVKIDFEPFKGLQIILADILRIFGLKILDAFRETSIFRQKFLKMSVKIELEPFCWG